jgi:hypothetical protein
MVTYPLRGGEWVVFDDQRPHCSSLSRVPSA